MGWCDNLTEQVLLENDKTYCSIKKRAIFKKKKKKQLNGVTELALIQT